MFTKFVDIVQVAEALPLPEASVDAVVGTLVLCSVKDVNMALKGIRASINFCFLWAKVHPGTLYSQRIIV